MSNNSVREIKYVYQLPYYEHKELCRLLDHNDKWEELGGEHMDFDLMTIHELRRFSQRGSPTEELLNRWGHQNHTILELFALLSRMRYYRAMMILKPFVDPKYHNFIYEGEQYLNLPQRQMHLEESGNNKSSGPLSLPAAAGSQLQKSEGSLSKSALDKDMQVGAHNLNLPSEPGRAPASKIIVSPSTSATIHHEIKLVNTVVPAVEQQAVVSNEQNDCITAERLAVAVSEASAAKPVQAQPESKDGNVPPMSLQRKMSNASDVSSVAESCGTIPDIPYKELMVATNGWDKHTILGKGGFGTVFKGIWKNTPVAIKRIEQRTESDESYQAQIEQSLRELRVLNACRHDNILPIYGFSMGGDEPCLVYQYMPNGSLEDRLLCRNGTAPLNWHQRHNIAEGTARGLQFLHNNKKPFIHGDIKSANILLDTNFEPRIGDFGLAREGPQSHYTHMKVSRVHGTRPYLPDEFLRSKQISTKVDTYSFGIVLFELATGQRAYDESRARKFLKDHVEACEEQQLLSLADRRVGLCEQATFTELLELGKLCVRKRAKDRPEMEEVLKQLESMSIRRRITSHAQNMVRQLSVTPSNPYELQLIHDILSQQRRLSSHSASPTASPLPYAGPDLTHGAVNLAYLPALYQQQAGPLALAAPAVQNNPFVDVSNNGQGRRQNVRAEDEDGLLENKFSPAPPDGNCNNVIRINRAVALECNASNIFLPSAPEKAICDPNYNDVANPFLMNPLIDALTPNANGVVDTMTVNVNVKIQNTISSHPRAAIKLSAESDRSYSGNNKSLLPLTIAAATAPSIAVSPPTGSFNVKHILSTRSDGSSHHSSAMAKVGVEAVQGGNNISPGEASAGGLPLLSMLGLKSESSTGISGGNVNECTHVA